MIRGRQKSLCEGVLEGLSTVPVTFPPTGKQHANVSRCVPRAASLGILSEPIVLSNVAAWVNSPD